MVLENAKRGPQIDFLFALAYGSFFLRLTARMWRCCPTPIGKKWRSYLPFGTVAAVLDECENIFM